jgi:ABC-2 type transport system permease protein
MSTLLRDTQIIFFRAVQISLRDPIWIIFGLFQPLCFLLLFAPLLEKLTTNPAFGSEHALLIFAPGLLGMIGLYGTSFVGFSLIDDIRTGVIERLKVTPMNRTALFLGRALRDISMLMIQSLFLLSVAIALGLRVPILGASLSLLIVALIGFSMATLSYTIAYIIQSDDGLAPIMNFLLLPLQLLAGIMLPLSLAPQWLQTIALANPLYHAINAMRALFFGHYFDNAVFLGFGSMSLVALLLFFGAKKVFNQVSE